MCELILAQLDIILSYNINSYEASYDTNILHRTDTYIHTPLGLSGQ